MKKLVLLRMRHSCYSSLRPALASAKKPAPDTFTITGYTTNDPFEDLEPLPNGHLAAAHNGPAAAEPRHGL